MNEEARTFDPPKGASPIPVPDGEPISDLYDAYVNGIKADLYEARVSAMPLNRPWPGQERPIGQSEMAAILLIAMTSPAEITLTAKTRIDDITIRPLSRGVMAETDGQTARFTVSEPGQYSVEINGRHHNLHIFADRPEYEPAKPEDYTYYFAPGVHEAGNLRLSSGESVYIAAGAVVHGAIQAYEAHDIRICGRGILDYSKMGRHDPLRWEEDGLINLARCRNTVIDGIVLRDSSWWTITSFNCVNLEFRDLKSVGMWRYNSDGFDFVNCQNVHVDGCFLRNFDDVLVIKGLRVKAYEDGYNNARDVPPYELMSNRNFLIENCVVWCDWGGALEMGAETVADEYCNIVYRNIDIIHVSDGAMRIQSGDRAVIHNVLYEGIRVEYSKYDRQSVFQHTDDTPYDPPDRPYASPLIIGWMYRNRWTQDGIYGDVHDIRYKDISVYADEGVPAPEIIFRSADENHKFDRITIENLTLNGAPYTPKPEISEYTKDITING